MYYYQHHIGDFLSATGHLNDHQIATYLRMIWSYYDTEKPLSGDIDDIAFAMRSDEKTVRLLLRHFFIETPEGWLHERCQREIDEYRAKSEKARISANARWKNANALRSDCERIANEPVLDANQEPITNNIYTSPAATVEQEEIATLDDVVSAYHEAMPMCPAVRMMNSKRKSALKSRQRDYPKAKDVHWWRAFFERAAESKFLTGSSGNWIADIDFFLSPKGFTGVIEGKYQ